MLDGFRGKGAKNVNQLVEIYLQSLMIAIVLELLITMIGIPFAAMKKFKTTPTVKSYLLDMLLVNILTSPLLAFAILAFTYMWKVQQLG